MIVRSALVAFALSFPLAVAGAQSFEYAPGTSHYRITSVSKISQEIMGTRNDMETSADQKVSVVISKRGKDTLALTTTLDSVTAKASMPMPIDLSQLRGMKVNSLVSPLGVHYSSERVSDPAMQQVASELGRLLPRLRAKLASGDAWTDTTKDKVQQMGMDIERTVVATAKVLGDTTIAGERAWRIERSHHTLLSGSGDMQGQALTLEGTANGMGIMYISPKGVYLGSVAKEEAKNTITLVASGMVIPVTSVTTATVERLR